MPPRKREYNEDYFRDSTMTFGEHLEELRACLFKAIVGLVIGFLIGLSVSIWVVPFIQNPLTNALAEYYVQQAKEEIAEDIEQYKAAGYTDQVAELAATQNKLPEQVFVSPTELRSKLGLGVPQSAAAASDELVQVYIWRQIENDSRVKTKSLGAQEPFSIFVKAAFVVGLLISSPWVFYQIWAFVAAGLYPHEKRFIHVFLPFSIGLFFAGASLAFFFVFQPVLGFLLQFNKWLRIDPDPRISDWLNFVMILPLGFGISFQLPLVMLFLERIGVFDLNAYLSKWRISVLVICVLSMLLTPADPYSMLLMAIPLTALYFGGVLLCRLMPRDKSPYDD
jgi:sec-independent protein translocase protein TatC